MIRRLARPVKDVSDKDGRAPALRANSQCAMRRLACQPKLAGLTQSAYARLRTDNPSPLRERRLVRAAGLEPAQAFRPYGFSYHFGFRRHREVFVVWTIPSPRHFAVGAARLVSTPSSWWRLGSGLPFERFPRIWAVLHPGFPARALNQSLKSVASTSFATPALARRSDI